MFDDITIIWSIDDILGWFIMLLLFIGVTCYGLYAYFSDLIYKLRKKRREKKDEKS